MRQPRLQARRVVGAQQREHPIVRVGARRKHPLSLRFRYQPSAISATRQPYTAKEVSAVP